MRNTDTTIRRKRPHGMRIIYIALSLYCLYNISLFVLLFIGSLKGKAEIFSSSIWALPEAAVWQNYVDAWNIGKIGTYTLNSIYVTGMTMLLTIILASMAAYVLGRIPFRASNLIMTAIMIGMMLPPFVIAIPLFDILKQLKLLNNLNGLILVYVAKQLP